jgi:hypothetical protein
MPDRSLGALIILAGLALVVVGALFWTGALAWFGRLPGDIRVERPGLRVYVPITSMVILSVVLTIVLALVRRWWP